MTDLVSRVRDVLPEVRRDLEDLVRIQSVWADPARRDDVARSADAVATLLREAFLAPLSTCAPAVPLVS